MALSLRLRGPTGVVPLALPAGASLRALGDAAAAATGLARPSLVLRAGFPPSPLDLATDAPAAAELRSGEVLTAQGPPADGGGGGGGGVAAAAPPAAGRVVQRVVPDDNSCLFRSVAALLAGGRGSSGGSGGGCGGGRPAAPEVLRRVCADAVAANPALYSTALLQRSNADYCRWIMRDKSWGGEIELAILSSHYGVALAAWDVANMVLHRYGGDSSSTLVGFLAYDGLHYNYLALHADGQRDVTLFAADDEAVADKARAVAQAQRDAGSFTNTANFRLSCKACGVVVTGEKAAQDHGNATGHAQFEECK